MRHRESLILFKIIRILYMKKILFKQGEAKVKKHNLLVDKINFYIKNPEHIIDVGYASYPNAYIPNLYGIDVQDRPANLPSNYKETKVVNLNTDSIPYNDNMFDGVFALDVIEHISNPIRFLFDVNRVLKDDGYVFIHTPNANYIGEVLNNIFVNRSPLTLGHVNLFTRRTMRVLFKHAGFDLVEEVGFAFRVPKTPYHFHVTKLPAFAFEIMYIGRKIRPAKHGLYHKDYDGERCVDNSRYF